MTPEQRSNVEKARARVSHAEQRLARVKSILNNVSMEYGHVLSIEAHLGAALQSLREALYALEYCAETREIIEKWLPRSGVRIAMPAVKPPAPPTSEEEVNTDG